MSDEVDLLLIYASITGAKFLPSKTLSIPAVLAILGSLRTL